MMAPAFEERHYLIENIGSSHQRWERGDNPLPVLHSRLMMLIIGNFER
jgi:hypothetical protein